MKTEKRKTAGSGTAGKEKKENKKMKLRFKQCEICGNVVCEVKNGGVPVMCCGRPMRDMVPDTVDASLEKHVPEVTVKDGVVHVQVGSVLHPSTDEHYIGWIILTTDVGVTAEILGPGDEPKACFRLREGERPDTVYAYCSLHGLWSTPVR